MKREEIWLSTVIKQIQLEDECKDQDGSTLTL